MPVTELPVLVTGVSGYIGAEITRQLLDAGYRVRGTTRGVAKAREQGHVTSLPGATDRLDLVEADLLTPSAFDAAAYGCEYVIHLASPYVLTVDDPQRDLVDPAVDGTLAILESAARSGSVRRLVLTSSCAAIMGFPDRVFDEEDWNTDSSLDFNPYSYSKTMAERTAWDFVETKSPGFDLVSINPSSVIGPSLIPRVNASHGFFIGATDGSQPAVIYLEYPFVDVRDVALAHILAMETPAAKGRYIASAGSTTVRRIVDIAKELGLDERYKLPRLSLEGRWGTRLARMSLRFQPRGSRDFLDLALGRRHLVDNSKIRDQLGITFRDLDQTIADTWLDLDRWGHLGRPRRGSRSGRS